MKISSAVEEIFSIDIRSLAVFRMALAIALVLLTALSPHDIRAFYTDFGILPRAAIPHIAGRYYPTFHTLSGSLLFQEILLALSIVWAFGLLIGYRTRLMTFLSWLFLISLQGRNNMIIQGGDAFLRVLLFWSLFLPLGAYASVDSLLDEKKPETPTQFFSIGSVALFLQIMFVYWFSAALKWPGAEWRNGSAVYYALSIDQFATPLGLKLLQYSALLPKLTHATLWFEIIGPLLLLVPFGPVRLILVFLFCLMHAGFRACLELGPFPWIAGVAMLTFLPEWFWKKIGAEKVQSTSALGQKVAAWIRRKAPAEGQTPSFLPKLKVLFPYQGQVVAGFFLIGVLWFNISTLDRPAFTMPEKAKNIYRFFRLDQKWGMFSPYPIKDDGWYVMPGRLKNGEEVDVFNQGPVIWSKPPLVSATYKSERWRKYMMNLSERSNRFYAPYYAEYLCRDWNTSHDGDQKLTHVEIYFLLDRTYPDNYVLPATKIFIANADCPTSAS